MRNLVLTAAVLASAAAAVPASAKDRAPFTGPRVEALAGYDNLRDAGNGDTEGRDGFAYGGAIGYDVQAGRAIVGVEAEATGATTAARTRNLLVPGDRLRVGAGRDLYAGARVGYAISPVAMVYAKAGYTNARVEAEYRSGTTTVTDRENLDGYRVGAGLEYNVGPRTYVKGEYRYSNYGNSDRFDIDASRHQIMGGVGVRF